MDDWPRVEEILKYAYENAPLSTTYQWINWCANFQKLYYKLMKVGDYNLGEINKISSIIAILHSYQEQFRAKQHRGGLLQFSTRRRISDQVERFKIDF